MKKIIELTPEWVLDKFSQSQYVDGNGNISFYTSCATDANWLELALESLNVAFEIHEYVYANGDADFGFDFRIEDIQNECPTLYLSMLELDISNNSINPQKMK